MGTRLSTKFRLATKAGRACTLMIAGTLSRKHHFLGNTDDPLCKFKQHFSMDSEWRLLSLEYSSTDIPPLLVKYKFENSSYTVYLSDMTECWIETLDRKQIIKRALEIDTSIDPSEGVDQFRSLLRCLRDALAESTDARLTVQRWSREEMVIAVESPLPRPLDPLKWVFYFKRGESCAFTDQLLMPLLDQKLADASATSLLLTEIREKDSLISKLLDAIQADGVSMSRIFPSLQPAKTRVRSYSRQILGKSIKGMSEFDEGKWRTEMRHVDYSSLSPPALISKAFSNQTDDFGRNIKFGDLVSWRNFVRGSAIQSEGQSATETRHPESEGKVGNGQDAGQTSQVCTKNIQNSFAEKICPISVNKSSQSKKIQRLGQITNCIPLGTNSGRLLQYPTKMLTVEILLRTVTVTMMAVLLHQNLSKMSMTTKFHLSCLRKLRQYL